MAIKSKARLLVSQLRTRSHHLRCETGRWTVPKETWEERTCVFYNKGVVETEWHFIFECAAYQDIRGQYENNLKEGCLHLLFEEERLHKIAGFFIKIHNRRADIEKNMKMT